MEALFVLNALRFEEFQTTWDELADTWEDFAGCIGFRKLPHLVVGESNLTSVGTLAEIEDDLGIDVWTLLLLAHTMVTYEVDYQKLGRGRNKGSRKWTLLSQAPKVKKLVYLYSEDTDRITHFHLGEHKVAMRTKWVRTVPIEHEHLSINRRLVAAFLNNSTSIYPDLWDKLKTYAYSRTQFDLYERMQGLQEPERSYPDWIDSGMLSGPVYLTLAESVVECSSFRRMNNQLLRKHQRWSVKRAIAEHIAKIMFAWGGLSSIFDCGSWTYIRFPLLRLVNICC